MSVKGCDVDKKSSDQLSDIDNLKKSSWSSWNSSFIVEETGKDVSGGLHKNSEEHVPTQEISSRNVNYSEGSLRGKLIKSFLNRGIPMIIAKPEDEAKPMAPPPDNLLAPSSIHKKSLGDMILEDVLLGDIILEDELPMESQREMRDGVPSLPALNAKVAAVHNDLEAKMLHAAIKYEKTFEYDPPKKDVQTHFKAFMSALANRFEIIYGILYDIDASVTSNNEYATMLYVVYKENAWIADREARNALRKKRETLWKYFAGVADSFRDFASTALSLTESVTSTMAIESVVVANLDSIGGTMIYHSKIFDKEDWPYESLVSFEVGNDFKEAAKLLDAN